LNRRSAEHGAVAAALDLQALQLLRVSGHEQRRVGRRRGYGDGPRTYGHSHRHGHGRHAAAGHGAAAATSSSRAQAPAAKTRATLQHHGRSSGRGGAAARRVGCCEARVDGAGRASGRSLPAAPRTALRRTRRKDSRADGQHPARRRSAQAVRDARAAAAAATWQ
jgi:hypothetical protein